MLSKSNCMLLPLSVSCFSLFFLSISMFSLITVRSDSNNTAGVATDNMICPTSHRPASCPVKCFTTNPVCGNDGVTYWCGCEEALCAGAKVAKTGFCEIGNKAGRDSLSAQALLLVHIVWLIIVGFSVLFGLF